MRRAPLILALVALAIAVACAGLLGWVIIEPNRWLPDDADSRREVAVLQRQVKDLTRQIDEQRPYAVAVHGLCNAFRTITGLNNSDEYAIVVARALVRGIVESCAYGEIPPGRC